MRHDFGPAALLPSAFGALEAIILIYRCVGAPSSCAISQLGERRTYAFRAMPCPPPKLHSSYQSPIITYSFDLYDICIMETHAIDRWCQVAAAAGEVMRAGES